MIGALLGVLFGAGVALAASSFGASVPLSKLLDDGAADPVVLGLERSRNWWGRDWFERVVGGPAMDDLFAGSRFGSDLAVCDRARIDFVATVAAKTITVFVLALVVARRSPLGGGLRSVLMAFVLGLLVSLIDVKEIQAEAEIRRTDMLRALTAYVEFTRLAAHTQSVEGAMRAAAGMGATWPFRVIERVFAHAARHGRAPWTGMAELGVRYDMREITELGGALEVAAAEGTHVQEMLAAKASTMRRRMTEVEVAEADAATEKLAVPMAMIALAMFGLLLAPAVLAF